MINLVILPLYRTEKEYSFSVFDNLDNFQNTLSLDWLNENLSNLFTKFNISNVSIEGGEISLLSDIYFDLLFNLLKIYNKKISIATDFIKFNRSLIDNVDVINVLYNFNHNPSVIFQNIKAAVSTGKIINIKSIDFFVKNGFLDKISNLNRLKIKSWKIIPYQKTKIYDLPTYDFQIYENTILEYLKLSEYMQFSFQNKLELEGIVNRGNFPIHTVYITPNNKFGLGKINKCDEFFIEEYSNVFELEKKLKEYQNQQILLCTDCKYQASCLADRYFNLDRFDKKQCNGYSGLIKQVKGK